MSFSKLKRFPYSPDPRTSFTEFKCPNAVRSAEGSLLSLDSTISNKKNDRGKIPENNEVSTSAISKDLPGPNASCDVGETTHEATYISYKDGDSSSGISSEETNGGVRIKEELKEIQERCENLQQILHHEIEAKSSGQSVCIRKIRKLVEQTMYDTRDMMNYAKAYIRNDKCVVKCDKLYSEILEQILSVVNGAQANIQYSVIGLGISIEDSVRQLISGSEKKYGSVEIVHGMIEKLDKHHSEPKPDLLAAAQKKIIEQEDLINHLRTEIRDRYRRDRLKRVLGK